jgi:tetratricopeptide (TPR) repeat protein
MIFYLKKVVLNITLSFLLIVVVQVVKSQDTKDRKMDSLKALYTNARSDTSKSKALLMLSYAQSNANLDTAIQTATKAEQMGLKGGNKKMVAQARFFLSRLWMLKGDYDRSLECSFKALRYSEKHTIIAAIGNIYLMMGEYEKALKQYRQAMFFAVKENNKIGVATFNGNIGLVYAYQNVKDSALLYLQRSVNVFDDLGLSNANADNYDNIGWVYIQAKEHKAALPALFKSLELSEKSGNRLKMVDNLRNIGEVYVYTGEHKKAEECLLRCLKIAGELKFKHGVEGCNQVLSELYEKMGDYKRSLFHHKEFMAMHDTIINEESRKSQLKSEVSFEFEKKEANLRAQQEKERAVAQQKSRMQKIVIIGIALVLILVILFALSVRRLLKQTRHQKIMLEEKQREVMDSIRYAKRIQIALMPNEKYINRIFLKLKG